MPAFNLEVDPMLRLLSAVEINQIVRVFRSAITNAENSSVVLKEIQTLQRINTDLIIYSKAIDHSLVTALLMILEDPETYGFFSENPPLITDVIGRICANKPILSSRDRGRRLESELGL